MRPRDSVRRGEAEMRGMWVHAAAAGLVALVSSARAAEVAVTEVTAVRPKRLRVGIEYRAKTTPHFRVAPICACPTHSQWILASAVRLGPARQRAVVEIEDDLAWLASPGAPCLASGLAVEMLEGGKVVSSTHLPLTVPAPPVEQDSARASRLRLATRKLTSRPAQTSAAGLTWALTGHMQLELAFERTAFKDTSPRPTQNGLSTSLRVGF